MVHSNSKQFQYQDTKIEKTVNDDNLKKYMGWFGLDKRNEKSEWLLQFCVYNHLTVLNALLNTTHNIVSHGYHQELSSESNKLHTSEQQLEVFYIECKPILEQNVDLIISYC